MDQSPPRQQEPQVILDHSPIDHSVEHLRVDEFQWVSIFDQEAVKIEKIHSKDFNKHFFNKNGREILRSCIAPNLPSTPPLRKQTIRESILIMVKPGDCNQLNLPPCTEFHMPVNQKFQSLFKRFRQLCETEPYQLPARNGLLFVAFDESGRDYELTEGDTPESVELKHMDCVKVYQVIPHFDIANV